MEQQTRSIAARCPASSHLLTALAQCNDAVWQQHLLPRLWEDASISSVALSCKQLRALCQSNVYRLHLDTHSTLQLPEQQQHGAELAARFPNCQEVSYTADDEECLGHLVELLPGLARLPQLWRLSLTCPEQPAASATIVALTLEAVRRQLRWLAALDLWIPCMSTWAEEAPGGSRPWRALGRATQLLQLGSVRGFSMSGFKALAGLTNLRSLQLEVGSRSDRQQQQQQQGQEQQDQVEQQQQQQDQVHQQQLDCSVLGRLTSLTELKLPYMPGMTGLSAISSCTNLRKLQLPLIDSGDSVVNISLSPAECAAIGQLTKLKLLKLIGQVCSTALLEALPQLQNLQEMWVGGLPRVAALSALARLLRLMIVHGLWFEDDQPSPLVAVQLTSVKSAIVHDAAPLAALPNLRQAYVGGCQPATFMALSQHCKELCQIDCLSSYSRLEMYTLDPEAPVAERTAAIASLSSLPQLRRLYLAVNDDAEVSALAAATQLQQLHLVVCPRDPDGISISAIGLASLALLRNMQQLTLYVVRLRMTAVEVPGLLSSLQHVPTVDLVVSPEEADSVDEGLEMVYESYIMTRSSCPGAHSQQRLLPGVQASSTVAGTASAAAGHPSSAATAPAGHLCSRVTVDCSVACLM